MTILVDQRPGPGQPRPYAFPTVVRRPAAGGQVVAAHLPGQPLAVATLLLDAGAGREPAGGEGLAVVVAKALEEGTRGAGDEPATGAAASARPVRGPAPRPARGPDSRPVRGPGPRPGGRSAAEFALALESLGAELSTAVDWDAFRVTVLAPVGRLPAAVELLAEAVRTPRLAAEDLIRVRDDEAAALGVEWASPGPRADAALRAALYPAGARCARPAHGTPGSVAGLTVDALTGFHRDWFGFAGVLLVAGDLDLLDLDALGAVVNAGTGAPAEPQAGLVTGTPAAGRRVLLVDRPGSVQSQLRVGHTGPHRTHPDHVPVILAGTVLGGAFTSRLNHLIREVRGYTYGIRGEFAASRCFGRFRVNAGVQTAVTAPALVDTVAEITRTAEDGVTEDELAVARTWRAGQLSVDMQTPGAIARALATLVVYDLPDDYHATFRAELLAAGVPEVSRAAATHLRPGDLTLVVEGDAAVVRDDLVAADLGEVIDVPDPATDRPA